jgi:hypothetical protein
MQTHHTAQQMQNLGRKGDSLLVHMTPEEVGGLQQLAMAHGGSLTINPETGLYEASFLKKILPTLIGAGLMFIPGVNAIAAAGMVGGGYGLAKGSLKEGLMAGLQAYGGASLAGGLGAGSVFKGASQLGGPISAPVMAATPAAAAPAVTTAATTATPALQAATPFSMQGLSSAVPNLPPTMMQKAGALYGNFSNAAAQNPFASEMARRQGATALTGLGGKVATGLATTGLMSGISGALTPDMPKNNVSAGAVTPYEEYEMAPREYNYAAPGQGSREQMYSSAPVFRPKRKPLPDEYVDQNYAAGGVALKDGAFIIDARTVSELGNGSSRAGQELLAKHGGQPIEGAGDGVSDSIRANIGGTQEARVARDEVKFDPEAVRRIGGGSQKRGAQKLYALMDRAQKARKHADRGEDTKLKGLMAAR